MLDILSLLTKSHWQRRKEKLIKNSPEPLKAFYQSLPEDFNKKISDFTIVAIDLETTGLGFNQDEVLSIGCVDIVQQQIDLASSFYDLVKPKQNLSEDSIIIHGITHDELHFAASIDEQLTSWLHVLSGKVMLAHHSTIELNFLNMACQKVFGAEFFMPYLDTLQLEKKDLERSSIIKEGDLRITKCRSRHGLPRYPAHHALKDAISCGELFLAQYNKRFRHASMADIINTRL